MDSFLFFLLLIHLFTCAYTVWVISPLCPHPHPAWIVLTPCLCLGTVVMDWGELGLAGEHDRRGTGHQLARCGAEQSMELREAARGS
jgi:hypothetical protein